MQAAFILAVSVLILFLNGQGSIPSISFTVSVYDTRMQNKEGRKKPFSARNASRRITTGLLQTFTSLVWKASPHFQMHRKPIGLEMLHVNTCINRLEGKWKKALQIFFPQEVRLTKQTPNTFGLFETSYVNTILQHSECAACSVRICEFHH